MTHSGLTILVSGMIAGVPFQGGATWAVLQYLLGLQRLGHRVCFVEQIDAGALLPAGTPLEGSANASYCRAVMGEVGLGERWALVLAGTRQTAGLPFEEVTRLLAGTDVLLNLSGGLDAALAEAVPVRVYVDLDPGFTQLWHRVEGIDMRFEGHTHFVTVGPGIAEGGSPGPPEPTDWIPTLQPVVLDRWPVAGAVVHEGLTTVAHWRSHGSIEHDGVHYGQKAHSLRSLVTLPTLTGERFYLALAIHRDEEADLAALGRNGWELLDPARVAGSPAAYQRFIQGSKGEFGIAKSGYVASRCGWFSDRSICYLASGRPVIAQETGYSRFLPTGEGLLPFRTAEDVLSGIERLNADYGAHRRAARAIAETYFDSDRVLGAVLERVGVT